VSRAANDAFADREFETPRLDGFDQTLISVSQNQDLVHKIVTENHH